MIDNDNLFDALGDVRRRRLLVELLDHDPQIVPGLSARSREIAAADDGLLRRHLFRSRTIDGVNDDRLRLYCVHLPKLAGYGFIEWDRDAHTVTKGPRFDEMRPLLELLDDPGNERPAERPAVPVLGEIGGK